MAGDDNGGIPYGPFEAELFREQPDSLDSANDHGDKYRIEPGKRSCKLLAVSAITIEAATTMVECPSEKRILP